MTAESPSRTGGSIRAARRRAVLELVEATAVGNQEDLAALLRRRGFAVTQATVSRDIAELGLVKAPHGEHHAYVTPRMLADDATAAAGPGATAGRGATAGLGATADHRTAPTSGHPLVGPGEVLLRRVLADYPVRVGQSGLTLVLVSTPGTAAAIAQAIDESGFDEQVGTLAGDNTLLVLFADEASLERWQVRLATFIAQAADGVSAADLASTYP
jgi:transcriptional regulator of arginine metabolism